MRARDSVSGGWVLNLRMTLPAAEMNLKVSFFLCEVRKQVICLEKRWWWNGLERRADVGHSCWGKQETPVTRSWKKVARLPASPPTMGTLNPLWQSSLSCSAAGVSLVERTGNQTGGLARQRGKRIGGQKMREISQQIIRSVDNSSRLPTSKK